MEITKNVDTEQIGAFGMSATARLVAPVSTPVRGTTVLGAGYAGRLRTGFDKTVLIPSSDVHDPPFGSPPV